MRRSLQLLPRPLPVPSLRVPPLPVLRLSLSLLLLTPLVPPATGAPAGFTDTRSLLPPDGFLGEWTRAGEAKVFRGAELYGHIDGGAESFLELGFEELAFQAWRRGEDRIILEIYRMSDPEAALGIYLMQCGPETRDPAFAPRHTVGRYQLAFVRNRHYVIATNERGTKERVADLLEFGRYVASRLGEDVKVPLLDLLPTEDLVERSVRIVRGPFTLQPIVPVGRGDVLLLGGRTAAAAADYRLPGGGTRTLLIAPYPDPDSARAALGHLRKSLDPDVKILEESAERLAFRSTAGLTGSATLSGSTLRLDLR